MSDSPSMIEGDPPMVMLRRILADLDEGRIPESVNDVPPRHPSQTPEEAFRHYEQFARNVVANYAAMLDHYRWVRQQKGLELTLPINSREFAGSLAGFGDPALLLPLCQEIADRVTRLVPSFTDQEDP